MKRTAIEPLPWLVGLLALSLAAAGWIWFERNFDKRTRRVEVGYSAAARHDAYLAAERFLQRIGIDAQGVAGRNRLRELPPPGDMLIVNGLGPLNAARRDALDGWLQAGGRLLVEATEVIDPGAEPRTNDFLAASGALLRVAKDATPGAEVIAEVSLADQGPPLQVGFLAGFYLEDRDGEASVVAAANGLPRLIQYRVGDGLLTVISDDVFLTNADIGRNDHALLLAALSAGAGKVWLIYDQTAPGLTRLIWRSAPQAVVAALVLSLAWLWHLGGRLGPLLPEPARERRDLLSHLEAAAEFMWRHGRGDRLMASARQRLEQAWVRRHPLLRDMRTEERARWLAEHSGLSSDEVFAALYQREVIEADFVRQTRNLQRLWAAL
jgi:hypothetical protein